MLINGLTVSDYQAAISSLPILITPIASHYRYHRANQYHSMWYLCARWLVIITARYYHCSPNGDKNQLMVMDFVHGLFTCAVYVK